MNASIFYLSATIFIISNLLFAQAPADKDTIYIPGGTENSGLLETTINDDIIISGIDKGQRINPNKVYVLCENQLYYQIASLPQVKKIIGTGQANLLVLATEMLRNKSLYAAKK